MLIKSIHLENFRNHNVLSLDFNDALTIIHGPNGIGKTNVLEAISVLSLGKSPIAVVEKDLLNINEPYARVNALLVDSSSDEYKKEFVLSKNEVTNRVKKAFKLNGVEKPVSKIFDGFKTVLFEPADIRLVEGSPTRRRDFLDKILMKAYKEYRQALLIYNRALKNRNKLLDSMTYLPEGLYPEELSLWDEHLIKNGQIIQKSRKLFFAYAKENLSSITKGLFSGNLKISLFYKIKPITRELLEENIHKDFRRGTTSIGPHLDDFIIHLDSMNRDLELKNFGSRGQMRMSVLSLKLLEIEFLSHITNDSERPVLLLDDIFSEFDSNYRSAIVKIISQQQTIITTANLDDVPDEIRKEAFIIEL